MPRQLLQISRIAGKIEIIYRDLDDKIKVEKCNAELTNEQIIENFNNNILDAKIKQPTPPPSNEPPKVLTKEEKSAKRKMMIAELKKVGIENLQTASFDKVLQVYNLAIEEELIKE